VRPLPWLPEIPFSPSGVLDAIAIDVVAHRDFARYGTVKGRGVLRDETARTRE